MAAAVKKPHTAAPSPTSVSRASGKVTGPIIAEAPAVPAVLTERRGRYHRTP
jgi:hypothetical protein